MKIYRSIIPRILRPRRIIKKPAAPHYMQYKEVARSVVVERVAYWAPICGVSVKRIAIRDQKRRWGSCSSLGNLNFNYKVLFLPACLRDYIIIHELCHLKQLNHGPLFWQEVALHCPAYLEIEAELRRLEKSTRMVPGKISEYIHDHQCRHCPE
jgi:predicted metal-dependent hydrolase